MKRLTLLAGICTIGLLWLSGCGKDKSFDCFRSTGPIEMEERSIEPFDSIDVSHNINMILIDDGNYKVEVEAGKNLLPDIKTEVKNRQLLIYNDNTCNWVRSYNKPINVYVHFDKLWKITYLSSGDISNLDTIREDSLCVDVWGGCGKIELVIDVYSSYFIMNAGTSDIVIHGNAGINSIYSGDLGLIDCRNLISNYCFITHKGSNNCFVYAITELGVKIESIGDIYYAGNPGKITQHNTGTGRLIPLN